MTDPRSYGRLAGTSLDRLAALSDGVFAVAATLLVLDLRVPVVAALQTGPIWSTGDNETRLATALAELLPTVGTYLISFLTLGIFWLAQQAQLSLLQRSDRDVAWSTLAFLAAVTTMPFSTGLVAEDGAARLALVVYWLDLLALGVLLSVGLGHARRAGLLRDRVDDAAARLHRRVLRFQLLYAAAVLIGLLSTTAALAALFVLQLWSAFEPARFIGPGSRAATRRARPACRGCPPS